uniref:X-box-binding protein 1 n=1 Tax=Knipowitschia caucasica TaxID=637954 RepID=A0AAV2M0S9_KNICA
MSPGEDLDATAALELDELFGDLEWTLDRDSTSPLFDADLEDFCKDSGRQFSSNSSPERRETDSKTRRSHQLHGLNKNAIAARLNRIKKKEYVSSLERKVAGLSTENGALKQENSQLTKRVDELEDETRALAAAATMTTHCHESAPESRRRGTRAEACVCTWTATTCLWSSALNVLKGPAQRSKFSSR